MHNTITSDTKGIAIVGNGDRGQHFRGLSSTISRSQAQSNCENGGATWQFIFGDDDYL